MERVRQFAEETTFHGVKDLNRIRAPWAYRLWILILISCTVVMIHEMCMIAIQYMENPTATQVSTDYKEHYKYPRIIFCPNEWINETRVAELNISKPMLIYALSLLQDLVLHEDEKREFIDNGYDIHEMDRKLRRFLNGQHKNSYMEFYRMIANEPEMVSDCYNCNQTNKYVVASGVCVQLRLNPASSAFLIQTPPSFRYSEPDPDDRYSQLVPKYSGSYTADALYVSYLPQNDFFCIDPILLNRNASYVIRIKPTLYKRLDKPDKPCVPIEKSRPYNYSQLMCYSRCDEDHRRSCQGCSYLRYYQGNFGGNASNDIKGPICSNLIHDLDHANCSLDDPQLDMCIQACAPLCHEWVYETTVIPVTQRKLLTENKEEDITVAFSYQVRYGETVIDEVSTYSWDTFLSNVGGQLGLWMGASVVSVLHLLHFLLVLIYEQCTRKKANQIATNGSHDNANVQNGHVSTEEPLAVYTLTNVYNTFEPIRHDHQNGVVNTSNDSMYRVERRRYSWL